MDGQGLLGYGPDHQHPGHGKCHAAPEPNGTPIIEVAADHHAKDVKNKNPYEAAQTAICCARKTSHLFITRPQKREQNHQADDPLLRSYLNHNIVRILELQIRSGYSE